MTEMTLAKLKMNSSNNLNKVLHNFK